MAQQDNLIARGCAQGTSSSKIRPGSALTTLPPPMRGGSAARASVAAAIAAVAHQERRASASTPGSIAAARRQQQQPRGFTERSSESDALDNAATDTGLFFADESEDEVSGRGVSSPQL